MLTLASCGSGMILGSMETTMDIQFPRLPFATRVVFTMASILQREKPRPEVAKHLPEKARSRRV